MTILLLGGQDGASEDTYSQSVRLAAPARRCHWGRRRAPLRGGDSTGQPGRLSATGQVGRTSGRRQAPPGVPTPGPPQGSGDSAPALPPAPQADALTVAAREASEALGARVAALPREVGPAVAAAGQVLTRPVCEVRLAVAAWVGARES